jgi:GNAT superfamily N-acetyltransferase
MRPEELDEAAALYERVATATLHWMPAGSFSAAVFAEQAADEIVFVALADRRIVGLAALYQPDSFLHSLYVEAPFRGCGVGTALLAAASEAAPGPLSLKVEVRNARARQYYAGQGFAEADRGEEGASAWIRLVRR